MRKRNKKKNNKLKEALLRYISNNLREFFIITIIFFIGLVIGIIFINNADEAKVNEITSYINEFSTSLKGNETIDKLALLKESILSNVGGVLLLWFAGCTVIGMPILYCFIGIRGFCLGYTISAVIASFGVRSGLIFTISSLLLQNIIFIPILFSLAVSGIKLYKSIMKDKRKENIKLEIYRHTIFSIVMGCMLIISSLVEVYISTNIFLFAIKYI